MNTYLKNGIIHNAPQTIREGELALQKTNLANLIFKGTDIPGLANYPKKPKTRF